MFGEGRAGTSGDIGILPMDGDGNVEWLIETESQEDMPEVSPDGRWIAYSSNEEGQSEIYVRPFPNVGDGKWQISRDGGNSPVWGPDSRELLYLTSDGPGTPTMIMGAAIETEPTFNAGNPRSVFDGPYLADFRSFDISLNGERFLMIKRPSVAPAAPSDPPSLTVVLNWFEELKQRLPVP